MIGYYTTDLIFPNQGKPYFIYLKNDGEVIGVWKVKATKPSHRK